MLRILLLVTTLLFCPLTAFAAFDSGNGNPFSNQSNTFVTVDEAFQFNAVQNGSTVNIDWQIKPGYYLYRDKIKISGTQVNLVPLTKPEGLDHQDEFFGLVQIYRDSLFLSQELKDIQPQASISIEYQGCADQGFCYPPEVRTISLTTVAQPATANGPVSEQDQIAAQLSDNYWTLLLMFTLGIGLAFTPCVLPMYPILTSIVLGQKQLTKRQALSLSFIYVQGMALTYTLLGLVVASAGIQFQAFLQNPYILVTLSGLFILLALSMFGMFTLQLPNALQTHLNTLSNKQRGGTLWGVFLMGAISGLVCSPCTTAPLSGALIYVSQTGSLTIGALALYLLALGMGVPLIAVALFGQQALPKSGLWMDKVKQLFGFILLSAPIFLLQRLVSEFTASLLWIALAIAIIIWLLKFTFRAEMHTKTKWIGVVVSVAIMAFTTTFAIMPAWQSYYSETKHALPFVRVTNIAELEQQLAKAKAAHRPVMMDFYADWCIACKEFEKYTFTDTKVQQALADYVVLQADVTANAQQDRELLSKLNVLGLPTLIFWNADGETQSTTRVTGFMAADDFVQHLQQLR